VAITADSAAAAMMLTLARSRDPYDIHVRDILVQISTKNVLAQKIENLRTAGLLVGSFGLLDVEWVLIPPLKSSPNAFYEQAVIRIQKTLSKIVLTQSVRTVEWPKDFHVRPIIYYASSSSTATGR